MKIDLMKKKLYYFLIVILCTIWSNSSSATHIVGGDLSYKCLGNDRYEIILTVRRDCFFGSAGAPFDNPALVAIFSSTHNTLVTNIPGTLNGVFSMPLSFNDTLNETVNSECAFVGQQVCVETTTYIKEITLPFLEGGYTFAYQRCCRNETINNILDPVNTGSVYSMEISEFGMTECNASPSFNNWPPIYICNGLEFQFDHAAFDIDGDSLAYSLCVPTKSLDDNNPVINPMGIVPAPPYDLVEWKSPFDLSNLLGGVPLTIDVNTGNLTATPDMVGQYLVGVCVEEFRDGVSIGKTIRDFQFNVRACTAPPKVDFQYALINCETLKVFFNNLSTDVDDYEWQIDLGNGNIEVLYEENPSFLFPEEGTFPVTLIGVRASDGCSDTIVKDIIVEAMEIEANFNVDVENCSSDNPILYLTDNTIADFEYSVLWVVLQGDSIYYSEDKSWSIELVGDEEVTIQLVASEGVCQDIYLETINLDDYDTQIIDTEPPSSCGHSIYECIIDEDNGGPIYLYEGHINIPDGYQMCLGGGLDARLNHGSVEIINLVTHIHPDGSKVIGYKAYLTITDLEAFEFEDTYITFVFCGINNDTESKICVSYLIPYLSCNNEYECQVTGHGVTANSYEYVDVNYCMNLHNVVQDDCSINSYLIEALLYGANDTKTVYSKSFEEDFDQTICINIPITVEDFLNGEYNCLELFIEGDCPGISCAFLDCSFFYNGKSKIIDEESFELNSGFKSADDLVEMTIQPIPAYDFINVDIDHLKEDKNYSIQLRNLFNEIITEEIIRNDDSVTLDIESLNSGIYLVSILENGVIIRSEKVVKI